MKAMSKQWHAAAPNTGRQGWLHHSYAILELRNCPTRWLLLTNRRQRGELFLDSPADALSTCFHFKQRDTGDG